MYSGYRTGTEGTKPLGSWWSLIVGIMLFRFTRVWVVAGLLLAIWTFSAVRRTGEEAWIRPIGTTRPPVRILEFYASVGILTAGQTAMLCYGVENARTVTISPSIAESRELCGGVVATPGPESLQERQRSWEEQYVSRWYRLPRAAEPLPKCLSRQGARRDRQASIPILMPGANSDDAIVRDGHRLRRSNNYASPFQVDLNPGIVTFVDPSGFPVGMSCARAGPRRLHLCPARSLFDRPISLWPLPGGILMIPSLQESGYFHCGALTPPGHSRIYRANRQRSSRARACKGEVSGIALLRNRRRIMRATVSATPARQWNTWWLSVRSSR